MHCMRPDITFLVYKLSRFTNNPSKAIVRVLGYLERIKVLILCYSGYPITLEGYFNSSWITS